MYFAGIDLAWSPNNDTGIAVIHGDKHRGDITYTGRATTDHDIVTTVLNEIGDNPCILTIDAPLHVPNEEGRRPAEEEVGKLFRQYNAGAHPANRSILTQWTGSVRGEDLTQLFEEEGFTHTPRIAQGEETRKLFEVYPHPSMVALFDLDTVLPYKPRSNRSYETRWNAFQQYQDHLKQLQEASPALTVPHTLLEKKVTELRGQSLKDYEDVLDAVFCAYLAHYTWTHPDKVAVLGTVEEGYIATPVKDGMWDTLKEMRAQASLDTFTAENNP